MKKLLLLFLLVGILDSCENNDEINLEEQYLNGKSTIIATVLNYNEPVGEGITVITNPSTIELKTNTFGQVEFENIKSGKFDVYAYESSYGSGKTTVELQGDLQRIDINLLRSVNIEPNVTITFPANRQGFSNGEEIGFTASIHDNITSIEELIIKWESDIDGELTGSSITSEGTVLLKTASLSSAEHNIKLTVTNELGISSSHTVLINTLSPNSLNISLTQDLIFNISIDWDSSESDISKFELYRSTNTYDPGTLLSTLNSNVMNYVDYKVPYSESVFYYIKAYNSEGYSSKSNTVESKGSPVYEINAKQAEILPNSSMIYFRSGNKITSFDYEEMTIKNQSSFDGTIGYFNIENNGFGNELYIPNSDGWLYIYDLSTFELKESISVGVPVECVVSNGSGLLFTSVSPSPWWENPIRVFNRTSLSFIDGGGDFDDTRLKLLPSKNEIIEITTSISPIDMDYYQFDLSGNFVQHKNDKYHGDHPLDPDIFKISPSNNYLITSNKGAIYSADATMKYIGLLPRGSEYFSDFEFYETSIYAGLSTQKAIFVYDNTSFNKTKEIKTKGYPVFLFRKTDQLIVISSPNQFNSYNGPQTIGIEIIQL
jgi:hypothetical protein